MLQLSRVLLAGQGLGWVSVACAGVGVAALGVHALAIALR